MRPRVLLDDLRRCGFTLWLEDDKIRYRGTREPLTPDLLAEMKFNKPDLIRILADERPAPFKTHLGDDAPPKPYLTQSGDLVIPFNSDLRFHWWRPGGLKPSEVREKLKRLVN